MLRTLLFLLFMSINTDVPEARSSDRRAKKTSKKKSSNNKNKTKSSESQNADADLIGFDTPVENKKLSAADARHLIARTHFGVDLKKVKYLTGKTRRKAVNWLFRKAVKVKEPKAPGWYKNYSKYFKRNNFYRPKGEPTVEEITDLYSEEYLEQKGITIKEAWKKKANRLRGSLQVDLRDWWFQQMIKSEAPIIERMTLFWSNHFVTEAPKIRSPKMMYEQNRLLRKHALGSFKDLLKAISIDPAMLIYLDGWKNTKKHPNENFAREVMELFTLGEGKIYKEDDIQEAARAFTGWTLNKDNDFKFIFNEKMHDVEGKVVLGTDVNDGNDVLDVLLSKKQTAKYITSKIWRFIAGNRLPITLRIELADQFFASGYKIRPLLKQMLMSDHFYKSKGRIIKSPVDLMAGTVKDFEIKARNYYAVVERLAGLDQQLMAPPNVKGWPGGKTWINTALYLNRKSNLNELFRVAEMGAKETSDYSFDANWINKYSAKRLAFKLIPQPRLSPITKQIEKKHWIKTIINDPTYQMR